MSGRLKDYLLPLGLLLLGTIAIAATNGDLRLSSRFYIGHGWPVGDLPLWRFLYRIDRFPAALLGIGGLLLASYGCYRPAWADWKRSGVFLALLVILGPGLLVNNVFKEYWGRPRPREITQFDGTKPFLHPWQKGISHQGRSFPSGHSSAAFAMTAPYFIYRRTHRRRALAWLTGGLAFGILMSVARIAQGGHFLSDCLWAWGMVHLTAVVLHHLMGLDRDAGSPGSA